MLIMTNSLNDTFSSVKDVENNYLNSSTSYTIIEIVKSTQSVIDYSSKRNVIKFSKSNDDKEVNAGIIAAACAGGFILLLFFIWLIFRYKCRFVK